MKTRFFLILICWFVKTYYQIKNEWVEYICWFYFICRRQWLRGRASDSRLRELAFESCAVMVKPRASVFTQHCSSSRSCVNVYLAIDSGGYVYEQPSRINCSIWLDASQRSRDVVWVNRSVKEVKCTVERFEWHWRQDTAVFKNLPWLFVLIQLNWLCTVLLDTDPPRDAIALHAGIVELTVDGIWSGSRSSMQCYLGWMETGGPCSHSMLSPVFTNYSIAQPQFFITPAGNIVVWPGHVVLRMYVQC